MKCSIFGKTMSQYKLKIVLTVFEQWDENRYFSASVARVWRYKNVIITIITIITSLFVVH